MWWIIKPWWEWDIFPDSRRDEKLSPLNEALFKEIMVKFDTSNKESLARKLLRHLNDSEKEVQTSGDLCPEESNDAVEIKVVSVLQRKLNANEKFKVSVLGKAYHDYCCKDDDDDDFFGMS